MKRKEREGRKGKERKVHVSIARRTRHRMHGCDEMVWGVGCGVGGLPVVSFFWRETKVIFAAECHGCLATDDAPLPPSPSPLLSFLSSLLLFLAYLL